LPRGEDVAERIQICWVQYYIEEKGKEVDNKKSTRLRLGGYSVDWPGDGDDQESLVDAE
jgi:hypothetical protein